MLALMEKKLVIQLQGQNKGEMTTCLLLGGIDVEVTPLLHTITHSNQ